MIKEYKVSITEYAIKQMEEIFDYISHILLSPISARNLFTKLKKEISSLGSMPHRFPLTDREPWHTEGVRYFPVNNFIVYYIDDDTNEVWVIAVVYGRRDQLNALKDIPKN